MGTLVTDFGPPEADKPRQRRVNLGLARRNCGGLFSAILGNGGNMRGQAGDNGEAL